MTGAATRVGVIGAGFWAGFQLAAWAEQPDARVVAIANRSPQRARALADRFGIAAVFDDAGALLAAGDLDVVDIITAPGSHAELIRLVADHDVPIICQKPLAPKLETARQSAAYCQQRGVPLLVHENFRWQTPIRELAAELRAGRVGRPFRARIEFTTGFPVFENQPFLRDLPRFILSDVGVHVLDVARYLFGEATSLVARIHSVEPGIAGEDVATVLLQMGDGVSVTCELSFATLLEHDPFPEMLIRVEGTDGTLLLGAPHELRLTTRDGTVGRDVGPPAWSWVDPHYAVAQAAMVPCIADLVAHIRGAGVAETTAADNLRTLALGGGGLRLRCIRRGHQDMKIVRYQAGDRVGCRRLGGWAGIRYGLRRYPRAHPRRRFRPRAGSTCRRRPTRRLRPVAGSVGQPGQDLRLGRQLPQPWRRGARLRLSRTRSCMTSSRSPRPSWAPMPTSSSRRPTMSSGVSRAGPRSSPRPASPSTTRSSWAWSWAAPPGTSAARMPWTHVFGYTVFNDVGARSVQFHNGQRDLAKNFDTFCPMGPWIVTRDELPDWAAIRIESRVNGELRQSAAGRRADRGATGGHRVAQLHHRGWTRATA